MSNKKSNQQKDSSKVSMKPKKSWFRRLLNVVLIFIVLVGVCLGGFLWRISVKPLDLNFAKSTIETVLNDPDNGFRFAFDRALLQWPNMRGPILLGLQGGAAYDDQDRLIISVQSAALSLNKAKLFVGIVSPEGLIIRNPSLRVQRDENNAFSVGLEGQQSDDAVPAGAVSIDRLFALLGTPDQKARGILSSLKFIRIEEARLLVNDKVLLKSWQVPDVNVSFLREQEGVRTNFRVVIPRSADTSEAIVSDIEGDFFAPWDSEVVEFESVINEFPLAFLGEKIPDLGILNQSSFRFDASLRGVFGRDFSFRKGEAVLFSKAGTLVLEEHYDRPLEYQDAGFKLSYDRGVRQVALDDLSLVLDGVPFKASFQASHNEGGFENGFVASGRVDIAEFSHEQIDALWPKSQNDADAKEWAVDKISSGIFRDAFADIQIVATPEEAKVEADDGQTLEDNHDVSEIQPSLIFDFTGTKASFDFEQLKMRYKSTMQPVENGRGKGSFDFGNGALRIDVDSANILDLNVGNSVLKFNDILETGKGMADLDINVKGRLQSMLRYLSDEPIALEMDADIQEVKGEIDANVALQFSLLDDTPKESIVIDVEGRLRDAFVPDILKDLPLSGGPFALAIKDGELLLSGEGQLDGRDIALSYREFLFSAGKPYSYKVSAQIISDEELRKKLGIDLSDFLEGAARVDVDYTEKNDGSARADITADITQSRLFLEPFDYEKPTGQAGKAELVALLQNDELLSITNLDVEAPDARLSSSTLRFDMINGERDLAGGTIPSFQVGQTKGSIDFEIDPLGKIKLKMTGGFLDLRPFLNDDSAGGEKDPYSNPPMKISVDVKEMRTSDNEVIQNGKLYADLDGEGRFNQFEMDANVGSGLLYMRFKPDESGKRVFFLEAEDAGAALKAFEVYDNIRGGKLVIYGEPIRWVNDRNLVGKASITDFKVVDAPGLARLLSALSLPGVTNMLAGEGLTFTKLESDFDWVFKPEGSLLVLKNGTTSGNSLGLTFEGTFDNAANQIDVNGTIIPLSGVNKIIESIPLVGDILTGGSGGIFAATYSIKGQGKDADVSVNPLSVLAPGILRRILFEQN